jgi:hypothetical protein
MMAGITSVTLLAQEIRANSDGALDSVRLEPTKREIDWSTSSIPCSPISSEIVAGFFGGGYIQFADAPPLAISGCKIK